MPEQLATYGSPAVEAASWTFLTNHAHVFLCLAHDPEVRVRDVAEHVGITERATLRILHDLVQAGYVVAERVGRRNHYRLRLDEPMRHPMERARPIRVLVDALGEAAAPPSRVPDSAGAAPQDHLDHPLRQRVRPSRRLRTSGPR